jgi:hypothetical protein
MRNYIYSILIVFIALPFHLSAQRFENSYSLPGIEMGNDVAELSDGSIITVGNSNSYGSGGNDMMVMKSSKSGELLWVKYIGGTGTDAGNGVAIGLNDDIYCVGSTTVGNNTDGYLVKLDVSGNILWTKTFGGAANDEFKDVTYKSGKVYAIGNTASAGAGALDIWFLKTDEDGNIIQNKTLGFAADENANAVTLTSDGNLAITGRTASFTGFNVFVAKFNLSGDTLWTKKYNFDLDGAISSLPSGKGIAELSDQNLLICGIGWDGLGNYSATFHLRLNTSGNTVYSKWTTLLSDSGADVIAGKNGSYYLLINSCNFGCPIVLKKFDAAGTEILYKTFQYPGGSSYANFATAGRLIAASGSKILITGNSYLRENNADLYLAKIDTNGIAYTTATPVISSSGPASFCEGGSVTLTVPAGYTRYSWGRTVSNSIGYLGVNSNSIVVTTSGNYFCTLWNSKGMRTTAMVIVSVTPNPVGTLNTTGSLNFCAAAGESLTLTANTGFPSYQWYKNGAVIPGAVSNSYSPTTSGSYYVYISNACASITSATRVVNVNHIPTPIITCNNFDCFAGGSNPCYPPAGALSVQQIAGASYSWQVFNTIVQSGNSNFLNAPYPPGDYYVTATNACGSATSFPYNINTNPLNQYSGSAIEYFTPINGCGVGSNVTLNAPVNSSGPYAWYLNGSPIPGATNYFYIATQSGAYSMSYLDVFCFNSINTTAPVNVTLNTTSPTLSTPGGNTNCGGVVQISAAPTAVGITYTWYRDDVLLSSGSASTFNASVSGSYKCLVNNPACGSKMSPAIHVNAGPPIGTAIIQESTICSGASTQLYCSPIQGTNYTYQWKLNNVNIAGATHSTYSATQAGNYSCSITNACSTITTNTVSLSVTPSPTAVITPPLSNVICTPASATLNANTIPNATYQWLRNGSNILNAIQPSLVTNQAGTYTISITANGCNAISAPIILTSSTGPTSQITSSKYPLICSGDSVFLKSPAATSTSWQWKKNNVNIAGATDSIYKATATGVYTVSVSNPCSTIISSPIEVTVKSKPSAIITPLGATTFCNGDSVILQGSTGTSFTYYWKKNNSIINNAIESQYTAKQAGGYKVGVYNKFGCLKESSSLTVSVPCRLEDGSVEWSEENIIISPNPTSGIFNVNWKVMDSAEDVFIRCYDLQGRTIELDRIESDVQQFEMKNAAPGVYFLQMIRGDKSITKKIIKM